LNPHDYEIQELVTPKHGRITGIYYNTLRTLSRYFIAFGVTCSDITQIERHYD